LRFLPLKNITQNLPVCSLRDVLPIDSDVCVLRSFAKLKRLNPTTSNEHQVISQAVILFKKIAFYPAPFITHIKRTVTLNCLLTPAQISGLRVVTEGNWNQRGNYNMQNMLLGA